MTAYKNLFLQNLGPQRNENDFSKETGSMCKKRLNEWIVHIKPAHGKFKQ